MTKPLPEFDPLLLSRVRLGVVSVLVTRPEATFSELKALLELTQGNLTIHLRKLEDANYVTIDKAFVDRKPKTTCRITDQGRRAFHRHLQQLQEIADNADS